jgi:hypothetical protein
MIALVTKWQKNAPDSIPWPNTLNFIEAYSETNLPPGFTMEEYQKFKAYVEKLFSLNPSIIIHQNVDANDGAGNIINSRIFFDELSYSTFRAFSNAIEIERNELLSLFNLTRIVKVITDESQIVDIVENSSNYNYLDTIISF